MIFVNLVLLIIEILLGVALVNEYHFILEYRRDSRYFEEYKRMSKKECFDVIEDVNNCGF